VVTLSFRVSSILPPQQDFRLCTGLLLFSVRRSNAAVFKCLSGGYFSFSPSSPSFFLGFFLRSRPSAPPLSLPPLLGRWSRSSCSSLPLLVAPNSTVFLSLFPRRVLSTSFPFFSFFWFPLLCQVPPVSLSEPPSPPFLFVWSLRLRVPSPVDYLSRGTPVSL